MSRLSVIIFIIVCIIFAISWIVKTTGVDGDHAMRDAFLVTLAAFLTLAIMSFLYQDNPYYKFAEHLFVGVSAAYWMCMGFWSTIVGNLVPRVSAGLSGFFEVPYQSFNILFYIPIIMGVLLLMRLSPKGGWIARWPLAFIVGTTAGLNFVRYLRSDFVKQISATFVDLAVDWQGRQSGHFCRGYVRTGLLLLLKRTHRPVRYGLAGWHLGIDAYFRRRVRLHGDGSYLSAGRASDIFVPRLVRNNQLVFPLWWKVAI
jgi:hypothetical protein